MGDLQPTALSRTYTVRLEYERKRSPKVWVVEPALEERDGERPPHLYPDGTLCLYLPGAREWEPWMPLAHTVIPWALDWLLHYEIWLATGNWVGGGVHPGDAGKLSLDREERPGR